MGLECVLAAPRCSTPPPAGLAPTTTRRSLWETNAAKGSRAASPSAGGPPLPSPPPSVFLATVNWETTQHNLNPAGGEQPPKKPPSITYYEFSPSARMHAVGLQHHIHQWPASRQPPPTPFLLTQPPRTRTTSRFGRVRSRAKGGCARRRVDRVYLNHELDGVRIAIVSYEGPCS